MAPINTGAALCTRAYHDSIKATAKSFRAGTRFTLAFWGVDEAGKDAEYQAGNCNRCGSMLAFPVAQLGRADTSYEHQKRAEKVAKILALVPAGATPAENATLATALEAYGQSDRDAFAHAAGTRKPSEETWRLVCKGVRERKTALEIFREAMAKNGGAS